MKNYLNFETEVKNLEDELNQLKDPYNQEGLSEVDTLKISEVQKQIDEKLKDIYSNLDPWQTALVARHENRPKAKFFIDNLFDEFVQLSGDRFYGEDKSVISGFGRFNNKSVLVIGLIVALLAGIAVWLQVAIALFGPKHWRFNLMTIEWPEESGASVEGKERMELEKMDDQLELQCARMRASEEAAKARNRE